MSVKRAAADLVERILGARVVRPGALGLLFEEEHLRRFFAHYDVDCVFDVGANTGQYATMLRRRVGFQGFIVSYEPSPRAVCELRARAENDPRWFVEEVALDRTAGTARFNLTGGSQFSSLHVPLPQEIDLFDQQTAVKEQVDVCTSTVERELAKYQHQLGFRRPFLKMDTQGHDVAIAEGAGPALRAFVGLQSELAIQRIYAGAPTYENALAFYRSRGFELSAFVPNNVAHFPQLVETDCIMYRAVESAQRFSSRSREDTYVRQLVREPQREQRAETVS